MALGMHLKAGICILEGHSQCWKLQLQRPCCWCWHRGGWELVGRGLPQGVPAAPGTEPPEPGPVCTGAAGAVLAPLGSEAFPFFSRSMLWGQLVAF